MSEAIPLSQSERTMLRYALDLAQEQIWSGDGFTEDDQSALTSLRRLLDVVPPLTVTADGERCPHTGCRIRSAHGHGGGPV